ncbi:hypothetical protein Baya_5377 [Bagarius yarrelli]|uniref:Uncharacterized protein n=1 Tax=Bagarius yarrelli TaxID=175774 RepID=A0A556TWN6_BAGYA|nr:hypothetical protein Baya_5377 [Bagarius yarrelli]
MLGNHRKVAAENETAGQKKGSSLKALTDTGNVKALMLRLHTGLSLVDLHIRRETLLKRKEEWVSTPEEPDQCRTHPRFTSSFSLRLPFRKKTHNGANIRVATKLNSNDQQSKSDAGTKEADEQGPQFDKKDFLIDTLSGEDENASKSHTDDAIYSCGGHVEHDTSSHRSSDGIQHRLVIRDPGQPAKNCTRGRPSSGESLTDLRVAKKETVEGQSGGNDPPGKNVEGKLSHSNLIPFIEDTGSKTNSDCQISACLSTAINQTLSLPSFPDSHCCDNLKSDSVSCTAAMFTSTLFSVLAPQWTGRLRRHKRGFSDVGSDVESNTNLSAVSQNEQQPRVPLQQIQAQGDPVNDLSNRFSRSAETSRSSVGWQNESFSHVSESKKQLSKTSSSRTDRHARNQTTEFGVNPMYASVDIGERPMSTMSLQRTDYRRTSRLEEQGRSFSSLRSRPTTSTLLLSSRRLNSRKPSSESFQMQKQLSASISSLNLPSKSILRVSQPQPNLASPNLAKETVARKTFFASTEHLSNIHKPKPSSSEWKDTDFPKNQRYVITGDFDRINRNPPATNDETSESSFSNHLTKFGPPDSLRSVQDYGPNDWRISDNKNSQDLNTRERSTWISPNENANSRFVFPHISSDMSSGSILKRQINKTSMASADLSPSTSVQSNSINNMVESNKASTMNVTTSSRRTHSIANSLSVNLSSASSTPTDQNIQNSSSLSKPSSSPVNSVRTRTFTESLTISPRKNSSVEGTSPSHLWSVYLKRLEESSQSLLDQPSPSTPSEFKPRRVCTPSIYKYLRETSPPKSTQASPALSSPSPQAVFSKQIQEENTNPRNLRFTFDLNPLESRDPLLKTGFSSTGAPQSLPPDTGNRSVPRISKSPYSTLISTRAAANSHSSTSVTPQHTRSFSYSSSPVGTMSPKFVKRSYTSVLRDRLNQKSLSVGESGASTDIQLREKTHSNCQDGTTKIMTEAKFPAGQTNTLSLDKTHPKQTDSVIKTVSHETLNGIFVPHVDRNNTYTNDSWNSKERSLPLGPSPVGEVVQKEELTEISQTKGTFQETQGLNSKWSFFSLRSKKDHVKSSPSADKEGLTDRKGKITGLKTSSKVLNRLKLTFGGTFLDDSDTTSRRKTKKEEVLNGKSYESTQKLKEKEELPVKRQIKAEELLETKTSERTGKLDHMDDLTFRTRTKPENISEISGPEIIIKVYQIDDMRVKTQTKPQNHLEIPERSQKLHQTDGLTVKRHTEPEKFLDVKDPQRSQQLDQTNDLAVRTQTTPEKILGIKGLQRSQKLDQTDDVAVRTLSKPEQILGIRGLQRSQNLDQTDNGAVRTLSKPEQILGIRGLQRSQNLDQTDDGAVNRQTKPENISDIRGPEKSQKLDQTEDKNADLLNIMPHDPPKNKEQKLFLKSSTSLNAQMIDYCNFPSPTLGYRHEKQENLPDMEAHKRVMEESRRRLLGRPISPNWPQPDNIYCYATLPPGKRSRLGPSLTLSPFDCSLELQNDSVFFSNAIPKSDRTCPNEHENVAQPDGTENTENSTGVVLLSPSTDLMYGLQRKRSVSVSSVVSGRPSGPGRISTGSRQSSNNDLSSLDTFVTKSRHSSGNSPAGSPENVISSIGHISNKGPTGWLTSDSCLRSPDNLEAMLFSWDMETDPTPPNSPPHTRRISQIPSPVSPSNRNSPESLSPRGFLSLKNYKSTLSAFEESGSETTTDDEYYLNSDDENEKETAL